MKNGIRRALLALLLVGVTMALGALVAQAGGGDPYFETRLGPVPERPVETEPGPHGEGDLLDWSGVNWKAWADSLGPHPVLALVLALVGMGIVFVRREGWVDRALSEMGFRVDTAWNRVRQNRAGWWMTEILRRTLLPPIGAVIWAVKLVVSLPGLLAGALDWMFRRAVENALTVAAFVRADKQGKAAIIADQVDQFKAELEQAKAFPGLLWGDVRTRWSRGLKGYVRIWQDPNVTNAELLQWGADHASMVADGTAVGSAGKAVVARTNSWAIKVRTVREVGRFPVVMAVTHPGTQVPESALGIQQRLKISKELSGLPKLSETIPGSVWTRTMPQEALTSIGLEPTPGRLNYLRGFIEDGPRNFRPGYKVFQGTLSDDLYLVQFHANIPLGKRSLMWWTSTGQAKWMMTAEDVHDALALLNEWGPRNTVSLARVPRGTKVTFVIGDAAAKSSLEMMEMRPGGGLQLRFLDFDKNWVIKQWP